MRLLLALLLAGCNATWSVRDEDGDGVSIAEGDCDDKPGSGEGISPNASEVWYDGVDQNCDGLDDYDKDGDGHQAAAYGGDDCWDDPDAVPTDMAALNGFPQLAAGEVYPGAEDAWYDGIDQDCDASNDFDQDGDGFDSAWYTSRLGDGNDCFDAVDDPFDNGGGLAPADVNPAAEDTWYDGTDADCAGNDDFDQDGDGFAVSEECDDEDAAVFPNPEVQEVWYNGVDENCDGNDGDQDGDGFLVAGYVEADPDHPIHFGFGEGDCWDDPTSTPPEYVAVNGFDQPAAGDVFPGAVETWYDAVDADCAGDDDFDQDADGYLTTAWPDRGGAPGDDCDDLDGSVHPDAIEAWYDGVDGDCDGWSDYDQDHDGHDADGYSGDDCDDTRGAVNPDQAEDCATTFDDDCSGAADDEDAVGCVAYYLDSDGDTYGVGSSQCWCEPQAATDYTATRAGDCEDGHADANPGVAREVCSTAYDDDCDGTTDEQNATGCTTWYLDSDGDTYGSSGSQCWCNAQTGTNYDAAVGTDCDDTRSSVNPGAAEICDSSNRDEDCDGNADNNDSSASSSGKTRYYPDDDGDEYGDSTDAGTLYCDDPSTSSVEWATTATDCNDASAAINPGATEVCDSANTDEDCDGLIDDADSSVSVSTKTDYYTDGDGDGYGAGSAQARCDGASGLVTNATDCDDTSATIRPGGSEVCDSANRDEDCDGVSDNNDSSAASSGKTRYYPDDDGDEYGDNTDAGTLYCDDPSTSSVEWATTATDCNDASAAINPGASEVCDASNTDEDCDGTVDDLDASVSAASKTPFYTDGDRDGYGAGATVLRCDGTSTYIAVDGDCDDADATVNPGEADPTDGTLIDEDCDGLVDDDDLAAGDVILTEFFVSQTAADDWFEVTNTSGVDLDLVGWELTLCYVSSSSVSLPLDITDCNAIDTVTVPSSLVVPADDTAVFCNDASIFSPAACDVDFAFSAITSSGGMAGNNGGIVIGTPSLDTDSVFYWHISGSNDWPSADNNQSVQLDDAVVGTASAATTNDDYSTNDLDPDIWCNAPGTDDYTASSGFRGTPGAPNDACP